jgi:hypothetical protein
MAETRENDAGTRTRKGEKLVRQFFDEAGVISPRARLNSIGVRIIVVEDKQVDVKNGVTLLYTDLKPEVARAAALYGFMNSASNTCGKAGMTTQEMLTALRDRREVIVDEGTWTTESHDGPRTNDIIEALIRKERAAGRTLSEEHIATFREKLRDEDNGAAFKALVLSDAVTDMHHRAIKAERAAEALAKAKAKAEADEAKPSVTIEDLLAS